MSIAFIIIAAVVGWSLFWIGLALSNRGTTDIGHRGALGGSSASSRQDAGAPGFRGPTREAGTPAAGRQLCNCKS